MTHQARKQSNNTAKNRTTTVTKFIPVKPNVRNNVISTSFQKLQQQFSEKFGVATFDFKGGVSTIPQTRPATGINIGTGSTGLSVSAFNDIIRRLSPVKATVQTQPVIISGGAALIDVPITSKLIPNQEIPLSQVIGEPSLIGVPFSQSIKPLIPFIVIGGIGLIALMVLKN